MPDFYEGILILFAHLCITLGTAIASLGRDLTTLIRNRQQDHLRAAATPEDLASVTQSTATLRFATPPPTEESHATSVTTPVSPSAFRGRYVSNDTLLAEYQRTGVCGQYFHEVIREGRTPRLESCPVCGLARPSAS